MLKLSVAMKPLSFKEEELRVLSSINFKKGTSPKSISTPRCSSPKIISPKSIPTPRPSSPRKSNVLDHSVSFKNWEPEVDGVGALVADAKESSGGGESDPIPELNADAKPLYESISPRPKCELDAAAVKVQKVYKSYRTRRNLADCAVVTEEMWWKALDFASLVRSSVSFFNVNVPETAVSKWDRARKRVAKVGKGLSKNEKAQKLALQHWLEAIDPRHRYGHNLHLYYQIWLGSESTEPFFYWLDVGAGKEIIHEKCPRSKLHQQCINYLGPNEREAYEVIVKDGKLVYKLNDSFVETNEGAKWIFVLSTSRQLYIGKKQKGKFQHSSFLSGAATTAAGRLVAKAGIIMAIWPYSGHYLPTEENFAEFISFLRDNNVDLTDVKKCSVDDDAYPSFNKSQNNDVRLKVAPASADVDETPRVDNWNEAAAAATATATDAAATPTMEFCAKRLSCKWSSGTGARISCVRDYPADIQAKALEHVNLSPRLPKSPMGNSRIPIPSPRPSPKLMVSPRLAFMGLPSPRVSLDLPQTPRRS